MKTRFLFPNTFFKIGWIMLGVALLLLIANLIFGPIKFLTHVPVFYVYNSGFLNNVRPFFGIFPDDIQYEVFTLLFIPGCLFLGFSRLKLEDEFTMKLRLESLLWAVYITFVLFLLTVLFVYGMGFLDILVWALPAFLIIFIVRFYYVLFQSKKTSGHEE